MTLWIKWWEVAKELRPAFSRRRTFCWFLLCLAAMSCRQEIIGVTSIVRTLGLKDSCYLSLLNFFHCTAVDRDLLASLWAKIVLLFFPGVMRVNGRILIVADGIKIGKSGKKMPAVKKLHQESDSNTKPEYIMGHSCQAAGVLASKKDTVFCIPLISRIHEGLVSSNRDKRTLLDKMIMLVFAIKLSEPYYLIADAYYSSGKIIKPLLEKGQHLICRARITSAAFKDPEIPKIGKRGRKKKYGDKVLIRSLFNNNMTKVDSPVYGECGVKISYQHKDLLWKPAGKKVRFVVVRHPTRGSMILMSTDLNLDPVEMIRLYGLRFKIEVSFKQGVRTVGIYAYHFWMKTMTPLKRNNGNQYLHKKSKKYREDIVRKMGAYHCHIQTGIIAQGILQYLSLIAHDDIWASFGSWIRTKRPEVLPSEKVTSVALYNSLPHFLMVKHSDITLAKFLSDRLDLDRCEGLRLAS